MSFVNQTQKLLNKCEDTLPELTTSLNMSYVETVTKELFRDFIAKSNKIELPESLKNLSSADVVLNCCQLMIADKIFTQYNAGRISNYFFTYLN